MKLKIIYNFSYSSQGYNNYEKLIISINEAESQKNAAKLTQLKKEAADCLEGNKEAKNNLKRSVVDSVVNIQKTYAEYRSHEKLNLVSLQTMVEGINSHQLVIFEEIIEISKQNKHSMVLMRSPEEEVFQACMADEKLQPLENGNRMFQEIQFVRLFIVPEDIRLEEEVRVGIVMKNSIKN